MKRYLLCNGDATDLATWSNTPYFLLQAGLSTGLFSGGLALRPERLRPLGRLWNLQQLLRSGQPGGFQYSRLYNRRLLAQARLNPHEPLALLSHFPQLPDWPWPPAWQVSFYIDATTRQVFDDYGWGQGMDATFRRRVLEREKQQFLQARAVICLCQWAADSVIGDYGINPAKVAVVPGGANLCDRALEELPPPAPPAPPTAATPLRLGFLGKDWQRKGGPFLLELAAALEAVGLPAVVRAIGPDPQSLPADRRLEPLGFLNKQSDTARFASELRSWHFGTLFSEAEAAPRSNLECLRLGVPVLSHAVGGIASTLPDDGCGHLFAPHPRATEVAAWIAARLTPYAGYLGWRDALASRAAEFSWAAAAGQLRALLESC